MMDFKLLFKQLKNGSRSTEEVVNILCTFISKNYPVFGLNLYDEDFREEIILSVLENGKKVISKYDEKKSDFFTYFYCYIKNLIQTTKRKQAKEYLVSSVAYEESVNNYDEKEYNYQNIDYANIASPQIPYTQKQITLKELQNIFKNIDKNKGLLVISMKSIFYITDYQINHVCKYYNLRNDSFYKLLEYCRNELELKIEKKQRLEESRNHFYYNHRKILKEIEILDNKDNSPENELKKEILVTKDKKEKEKFRRTNEKISKGILFLRPTNKMIASILDICERQVEYYLMCAKKKQNNKNWFPFNKHY